MILADIQKLIEITGLQILDAAVYIIITALFIWLYKEFKGQFNKEQEFKSMKLQESLSILSKILSLGYQYKKNNDMEEDFFIAVYESYPMIDINLYSNIDNILNDTNLTEEQKIKTILDFVNAEIKYLTFENQQLFMLKEPKKSIDIVDNFILKLRKIVNPLAASIFVLIFLSILFLINVYEDNSFLRATKSVSFGLLFWIIPFYIDVLTRLNKIGKVSFPIIIILLIVILFAQKLLVSVILVILTLFLMTLVVVKGIRR